LSGQQLLKEVQSALHWHGHLLSYPAVHRPSQVLQVAIKSAQQSLYVWQEGLHWQGLVKSVPAIPHRPTQESSALPPLKTTEMSTSDLKQFVFQ
jgi:hypothetical protein